MQNHEGSKESKDVQNEFGYATKNLNKNSRKEYLMRNTCFKLSIIKPGRSTLLEFEKKISTGHLIETYSKYPDQVV